MKLERLALISEIVGGFAIIVTLVFLIFEMRGNTVEMRAANRHEVVAALRELTLTRAQSPSLTAAIEAACSGNQITPVQRGQYSIYIYSVMKSVEEAYFQYTEGRLDEVYLNTRIAGLMGPCFLSTEIGRSQFEVAKTDGEITAEFAEAIDREFAERLGR